MPSPNGSQSRIAVRDAKRIDFPRLATPRVRNQRLIDLGAECVDRRPKRRKTLRTNTLGVRKCPTKSRTNIRMCMTPLSAVVTTFNNAQTLRSCLESVKWADEIVVLDSFSTDETCQIAAQFSSVILQKRFQGYSKQKQDAIDIATNDWVILLDADEALSQASQEEIQALLKTGPIADGYTLPRIEQLFWKMTHTKSRMNHFLRLFNRQHGGMNDVPVHAAPEIDGTSIPLKAGFYHFGEPDIHTKVDKLNFYSTGLVEYKAARRKKSSPWMCVFYPPVMFLKSFIFKRNFLNGWAGFIGSVAMANYAFLKYAKLFEHFEHQRHGTDLLPDVHPANVRKLREQAESIDEDEKQAA
jgi:glycosyltransferase involved in cell wall biosynthesis